jgi:hypothetical protein
MWRGLLTTHDITTINSNVSLDIITTRGVTVDTLGRVVNRPGFPGDVPT